MWCRVVDLQAERRIAFFQFVEIIERTVGDDVGHIVMAVGERAVFIDVRRVVRTSAAGDREPFLKAFLRLFLIAEVPLSAERTAVAVLRQFGNVGRMSRQILDSDVVGLEVRVFLHIGVRVGVDVPAAEPVLYPVARRHFAGQD